MLIELGQLNLRTVLVCMRTGIDETLNHTSQMSASVQRAVKLTPQLLHPAMKVDFFVRA
jgi:hypothetical protein